MLTQDHMVSIHPYFKVSDGKMDEFTKLCDEAATLAATEPRCLYYGISFNGNEAFVREAYDGAEGVLAHVANVGPVLKQLLGISELTRVELHGTAEELEKLVEPLSSFNPTYFTLRCWARR